MWGVSDSSSLIQVCVFVSPFSDAAADPKKSPLGESLGHRGSWGILLPHANRRPAGWHDRAGAN